ncbi:AraC family transcriptional regulator [Flavobacteriaceae sp. LMIT009]
MNISLVLAIFSSIAVTSCAFLASYFLFVKNEHRLKDSALGFLFVAIALRIVKSIFYYVLPEIATIGIALGFFGFAFIGPLALTYFSFSQNNSNKLNSLIYLHLIFPIVGFVIIMSNRNLGYDMYLLANISLASYLGYIGAKFIYKSNLSSKWRKVLFYALVALSAILIYQLVGQTINSYAIGIGLSSLVLYFLFFYALQSPTVIKKPNKALPQQLLQKIRSAIEEDNIYLQPAITLAQFSEAIETPTYLVSKATKSIYNKSFPEVINSFRIKTITKKLSEPDYANEKIEDLAYDVGFNTSSAFYNAFKKETSMSPRAYQKMVQNNIIKS